jgi:hypothetical protein
MCGCVDHLAAALQENLDLLFGLDGAGPMLAAARTTSRVICNHGGAPSRLCWPAFPDVINVLAPSSTSFAGVLEAVHAADETVRKVTLAHRTTRFGCDVAGTFTKATDLGMTVQEEPFEASNPLAVVTSGPDGNVLLIADELALVPVLPGHNGLNSSMIQ